MASTVSTIAKPAGDARAQCLYWLEMMQRHREPRYYTCLKQYNQIASSKQARYIQRRALADLLKIWENTNLLSDLVNYAQNTRFISALTRNAENASLLPLETTAASATSTNTFNPSCLSTQHNTVWISELLLSSQEMDHFNAVANHVAIHQAQFLASQKYESNLISFAELTDIEMAQMASFTKAVASNPDILLHWEKHSRFEQASRQPFTQNEWVTAFEQFPSFLWKCPSQIGNILNDAGWDLFPLLATLSIPEKTVTKVPNLFQSFAFCIIMGCILPHSAVHKHPLWQMVALEALRRDDTDMIGILVCLCGLNLMHAGRSKTRTGLLPNPMALKNAAAWLLYQAIFVLPQPPSDNSGGGWSIVAPKTIALFVSSATQGWTSPGFIRVIYPSYQTSKIVSAPQSVNPKNQPTCCWCNLASADPIYYALRVFDASMPTLLNSIVSQILEYGTSVFHECSSTATIPASIVAKAMDSEIAQGSIRDLGNLALHFPEWISVGFQQGQFLFVPAQQLLYLSNSTVGKQYHTAREKGNHRVSPSPSPQPMPLNNVILSKRVLHTTPKQKRADIMSKNAVTVSTNDPTAPSSRDGCTLNNTRRSKRNASKEAAAVLSILVKRSQ